MLNPEQRVLRRDVLSTMWKENYWRTLQDGEQKRLLMDEVR